MPFSFLITLVKNVSETVEFLSKQILNTHFMCIDHEYPYAVIDTFKMKLVFSFHFNVRYIMRKNMFNFILFLRNTICLNDNMIKTCVCCSQSFVLTRTRSTAGVIYQGASVER